jgi:tetratricopeptide (TPR) repeat protein
MKRFKVFSIAIMLSAFAAVSSAQTLQESTEARNKGAELMSKDDIDGAIAELEKCVTISKSVGPEADENRTVAEAAIPGLYLKKADKVLDSKDYAAALKAFETAIASAEKYNNPGVKENAEKPMPQIYYAMGATAFQAKKYDEAINAMNQAIARDPNMGDAYFVRGACYQMQKNEALMSESYKLAMEKGGDAVAKKAKTQLFSYYYNPGAQAKNAQKWDTAIPLLSKAIEVDGTNATVYYALASCYNSKKNWDNAISNGEKAAELMGESAKIADGVYYELGTAYASKKDNGKACENFKKIGEGPFLKAAKYQIEVTLKCK